MKWSNTSLQYSKEIQIPFRYSLCSSIKQANHYTVFMYALRLLNKMHCAVEDRAGSGAEQTCSVLHMSVDIKWNHNFLKNYICKALTHPLFHLTFLRFTQVKVVLFFVIYPCFYHQVLSLSVLSLSSTCHCLQNTSWAHPLCISINTTSVKGSITAHLDYRISLLTGLFQFELMKPIFYMKARVMLLEYKLYHSTPLFKLVSGFCTELRIKPVFLIKV